jgi:NADPH2:quinone reductase
VVETLGAGVEGFAPGDAVSIVPPLSMAEYPAYGELATYPAHLVVKHPASLSWEAAAAVWMQYVTAYGALIDIAQLGKGDVVVIPAASSSVGLAAIQIANRVGAVPVAVTRTRAKAAKLAEAGAAHVIVSDEEKLPARLRDITGGTGARLVFDPIAGPGAEILAELLAPGGILIEYGLLSGQATPFPLFPALVKGLTMRGYTYAEIVMNPVKLEAAKAFILSGLADGSLKPIIARSFKFEDMVEAHRYLESNEQFGKIVVTL